MKKLGLVFLGVVVMVGLLGGATLAETVEHPTYQGAETAVYAVPDTGTVISNAKVFRLKPGHVQECNDDHVFDIHVRAKIAQWASVNLDFTGWSWYVLKPGTYYADSITASVASNGPLTVTFTGFGDLEFEATSENPGVLQTIETRFGYSLCPQGNDCFPSPPTWQEIQWATGAELEEFGVQIPDSLVLHNGYCLKLWNEIKVEPCNSAGIYTMPAAYISITLENQQHWVEYWDDEAIWEIVYVN